MANDEIRIRMYRIGFGDCFLLTLPVRKDGVTEERHILFDCGVHFLGVISQALVNDIVDDIAKVTNKRLDVIVATHAHQDHVSGFADCADRFRKFSIGEVWMPWTEDQSNPVAVKLGQKQQKLAESLVQHFEAVAKTNAAANPGLTAAALAVANLAGAAEAMPLLRSGFAVTNKISYLAAGEKLAERPDLPGLQVEVLGPPKDENFFKKMDPPSDQHFLCLDAGGLPVPTNPLRPFEADQWAWSRTQYGRAHPSLVIDTAAARKLRSELEDADGAYAKANASFLDKYRNNTSLVLLLTFRGRTLLFPGDAQYGNWRWWLDNLHGPDLLNRVDFLKVSHHGSINATPADAVRALTNKPAAMVSTQAVPGWKTPPDTELLKEIDGLSQQRLVRSDWLDLLPFPNAPKGPNPRNPLPVGFSQGAFWYDYVMPV